MADFEPVLLRRIQKKASPSLDAYRADGGYRALEKALNHMTPAQVADAVRASNLRGRGGAGFPTGLKWSFLPKDHPGPIYMCINADESEPCTFNNRILMEEDPHQAQYRGHHPLLLRHPRLGLLLLHPLRVRPRHAGHAAGHRRGLRRRPAR